MAERLFLEKISAELAKAGPGFDLSSQTDHEQAFFLADALLQQKPSLAELDALFDSLENSTVPQPAVLHLGARLASSLLYLQTHAPVHLSVVFAVFKEHNRIQRPVLHSAGEDFVRRKVAELRWLTERAPQHSWDMWIVDDGCPQNSGRLAQEIIESEGLGPVKVLFLDDAIRDKLPIVHGLLSSAESTKGGAIALGLSFASANTDQANDRLHLVLCTDADLSCNLAQFGCLLRPLNDLGCQAALGSRLGPGARLFNEAGPMPVPVASRPYLAVRSLVRNTLLPTLRSVIDTQCAFKLFRADALREILDSIRTYSILLDIELILLLQRRYGQECVVNSVPIVYVDSRRETNFRTDNVIQSYFGFLKALVGLHRRYGGHPPDLSAEKLAKRIDALSAESYSAVFDKLSALPERIPEEESSAQTMLAQMIAAISAE